MERTNTFPSYYGRFLRKFLEDSLAWPRDNVAVAGIVAVAPALAMYLRNPHQALDWELIKTTLFIYMALFGVYIAVRAIRVPWELDRGRSEAAIKIENERDGALQRNRELETRLRELEVTVAPVQHIHLPAPPPPLPEPLKHNVQCLGVEIEDSWVTISFQNVPIPGRSIADFRNARLSIEYRLKATDKEWDTIFPARWCCYEQEYIQIGVVPQQAFLASYYHDEGWYALNAEDRSRLPIGALKIKATLLGEGNLSLPPVMGVLTLESTGSASWTDSED